MIIKIILLILFLLMILGFTVFAVILTVGPMISGFRKAPYVPSFDSHLKLMKQYLKLEKGAKIIDLGCGDGKALRFFSKEFGLLGTGYDLNPFVIRYGRLSNLLLGSRDISLIRSNFKKAPLERYDYIYMYLRPSQMIAIEDRVFDAIGNDAVIISNSFVFVQHKPFDVISTTKNKKAMYLYRK